MGVTVSTTGRRASLKTGPGSNSDAVASGPGLAPPAIRTFPLSRAVAVKPRPYGRGALAAGTPVVSLYCSDVAEPPPSKRTLALGSSRPTGPERPVVMPKKVVAAFPSAKISAVNFPVPWSAPEIITAPLGRSVAAELFRDVAVI